MWVAVAAHFLLVRPVRFLAEAESSASSTTTSKSFIVDGIYNSFGQGYTINPDTTIFIPLSSGEVLEHSDTYSGVMVVATSVNSVTDVTAELRHSSDRTSGRPQLVLSYHQYSR